MTDSPEKAGSGRAGYWCALGRPNQACAESGDLDPWSGPAHYEIQTSFRLDTEQKIRTCESLCSPRLERPPRVLGNRAFRGAGTGHAAHLYRGRRPLEARRGGSSNTAEPARAADVAGIRGHDR